MQGAAVDGDMLLLEQLVALGAAIDFCKDVPTHPNIRRGEPKPPGSTALLLVLSSIITYKYLADMFEPNNVEAKELAQRQLKVAIQLVRLGTDCSVKLCFPPMSGSSLRVVFKNLDMIGKSAKDLARMIGSKLLMDTIEKFSSFEDQIELVHCRCGSRLPWKYCHYSKDNDQPYYIKITDDDGEER